MKANMEPIKLRDGYSRLKNPPTATYRPMTCTEAKSLRPGQRVPFEANDGTARLLTVNGAPKTWKRSPGVEVPIKYGLYEYARMGHRDLAPGAPCGRLLVLVDGQEPAP